jgi:hypothetical protein
MGAKWTGNGRFLAGFCARSHSAAPFSSTLGEDAALKAAALHLNLNLRLRVAGLEARRVAWENFWQSNRAWWELDFAVQDIQGYPANG